MGVVNGKELLDESAMPLFFNACISCSKCHGGKNRCDVVSLSRHCEIQCN